MADPTRVDCGLSITLGRRVCRFERLVPVIGIAAAATIHDIFRDYSTTAAPSTVGAACEALFKFFAWLHSASKMPQGTDCARLLKEITDNGRVGDRTLLGDVVDRYYELLMSGAPGGNSTSSKKLSRAAKVHTTSRAFRVLANASFWPGTATHSVVGARDSADPIPSLAELTRAGRADLGSDDGVRAVLEGAGQRIEQLSKHDMLSRVADLNQIRLGALRRLAEAQFQAEYDLYKRGVLLLDAARRLDPAIKESVLRRKPWSQEPWPESNDAFLGVILERMLQSIVNADDWQFTSLSWAVRNRTRPLVIKDDRYKARVDRVMLRMLGSSWRAACCLEVIIMCETAWNKSTVEELPLDPFVGEVKRGRQRIATVSAVKMRASGAAQEGPLTDGECDLAPDAGAFNISGVRAIKMWQEMSSVLRPHYGEDKKNHLITHLRGNIFDRSVLSGSFAELRSEPAFANDPHIGGLPITLQQIRPTVLQINDFNNSFEHAIPQAMANHRSVATTNRYISRRWMREAMLKQVRDFQNYMESMFMKEVEDAASALGISVEELSVRQSVSEETGLGFVCLNRYAGVRRSVPTGQKCFQVEDCAGCSMRRFVPTETNLEALYIFNDTLASEEDVWLGKNAERWISVWLPWRALTDAVVEQIEKSFIKVKYKRAVERAKEKLARGEVIRPTLW